MVFLYVVGLWGEGREGREGMGGGRDDDLGWILSYLSGAACV